MTAATLAGANPYVGLRPFERDDSLYYFGRREQTSQLLEQLHSNRFLAVVGSSGCGKSSLIRAGLIPALYGGFLVERRDQWLISIMKPGDAPTLNLASALCSTASGRCGNVKAAELEKLINEDQADAVADYIRPALGADANLLILVDQFEELFAFRGTEDDEQFEALSPELKRERGRNRAEAANFVDLLLALAPVDLPIYVVLTMRSDFLGDCEVFYGLPEAMNKSRYLVPRLTRQQLRDAVQGPALLSKAQVAPRLMDTVLNDLGGRTDQLPVLQHALFRTWNEWAKKKDGPIDLNHYEVIGGLRGALSQHANEALRDDDLADTALIFKRLTDTDPNQRRIRRPAHLKELIALCGGRADAVNGIIERFRGDGRSFLVVSNARDGDRRIDISHESLIRQWPQLRHWIDEERVSRDQFLELVKRARGKAALLWNPDLDLALKWKAEKNPSQEWAARYSAKPDDYEVAMRYLADSKADADAWARRTRNRHIALWTAAVVVMLTLSGLMLYAFSQQRKAVQAQQSAEQARQKALLAENVAMELKKQLDEYSKAVEARIKSYEGQPFRQQTAASRLPDQIANATAAIEPSGAAPPPMDYGPSDALRKNAPPSPVKLTVMDRTIVYSNVSLNWKGNAITVAPGEVFTVTFHWKGTSPKGVYCPTCYVQFYYGIGSKSGGNSQCFVSDIIGPGWSKDGEVKGTLTAPNQPGQYYVTQGTTLEYGCEEKKVAQSGQAKDAIAVISVFGK